jgi:hypothetical protein
MDLSGHSPGHFSVTPVGLYPPKAPDCWGIHTHSHFLFDGSPFYSLDTRHWAEV